MTRCRRRTRRRRVQQAERNNVAKTTLRWFSAENRGNRTAALVYVFKLTVKWPVAMARPGALSNRESMPCAESNSELKRRDGVRDSEVKQQNSARLLPVLL